MKNRGTMMENKKDSAWLSKQIDVAKKDIKTWPDWMQKAARFEGDNSKSQSNHKPKFFCQVEN